MGNLMENAYQYELKSAGFFNEWLNVADLAHTAMLLKTGVIAEKKGKAILKELLALRDLNTADLKFHPSQGDIYTNRELFLIERLGKIADYIPAGRARREATNIAFLLACRERTADLGLSLAELSENVLSLVRKNTKTYMSDFTYLQHAHPTTLGHYLLGYLYPIIRDLVRLKEVHTRINQSPAGSGSVNGSSLPLDRAYLQSLLEFDDIIVHTRDAMWRHDVVIECSLPLITVLTTLSRLAEDLLVWNTPEFGFIDFAPSMTRRSIIMPQKKNPYALAFIRGLARTMLGRFISIAATGHTASGQPDNRIFAYYDLPDCISETQKAVSLLNNALNSCTFHKDRLMRSAIEGFTTATDLVDLLILEYGIDNRTAYNIVSRAIEHCVDQGHKFNIKVINESAMEFGVKLIRISSGSFQKTISVESLIERRKGIGGAGAESMNRMIMQCKKDIAGPAAFFKTKLAYNFKKRFYGKIDKIIRQQ